MAEPDDRPIVIDDVWCPRCLATLDRRMPTDRTDQQREMLLSPQLVRCVGTGCTWSGLVTFGRRG